MFSPELKKGSTEMLILSLVEARPRHGYEIGKADRGAVGRAANLRAADAVPNAAAARKPRADQGALGGKSGRAGALLLPADARRAPRPGASSGKRGRPTSSAVNAVMETAMRDWTAFVRAHLALPGADPGA